MVGDLLERNASFALESDIDHNVLVSELDDGASDDIVVKLKRRGLGGLFAVKALKCCSKIRKIVTLSRIFVYGRR